jgi:mono/diheme cytochrome c family protein
MMHPKIHVFLAAGAISICVASGSRAADNAETGRSLAETWCKPCHAVNQRQASDLAPPFTDIITRRSRPEIASFLANPHGQMPNIQLSRQQIADVVAFMATLK